MLGWILKYLGLAGFTLLCWCAAGHAQTVEYYHLDALGSIRAVTDANGNVIARHDFLPFGEEWGPKSYGLLFTGKERDSETDLDYFGARYYRSDIGRFTTIDPVYTWQENLEDPQRWNRYAYVRNNPLKYTDPTGLYLVGCGGVPTKECSEQMDRFEKLRHEAIRSKDSAVRAVALRLGDPGKNGPTVSPDFKGDLKGANGDFNFSENVLRFKPGISGVEGVRTLVHEASHHSDRVLALGVPKYDDWQITRWESDVRAFDVGAMVQPYPVATGVLRPGARAAIEAYMRTRAEYYNRAMYYPIVNRGW